MHLMEMLQQDRSISVAQAAPRLRVSASSIRRDLGQLERQGLLTRVCGGAIADGDDGPPAELSPWARASENAEQKRRIGAAAAALIGDGQTVLVTGGSTTDAMLPLLGGRSRLTVVTNNLQTAVGVAEHPDLDVAVIGGYLRREEMSLLGHLGNATLSQLSIERAIVGAYAVDADGLRGAQLRETETDRALLSATPGLIGAG
jgi:DeoR/GlpR family transcriptional regulator of sugar metabolism